MRELRFHRDLYRGESVDEAVKTYQRFADFELEEQDEHWVVRLTASSPGRERRVAGELCNYALGLTMRERGESA